jgi:hypothetical protein
MIEPPPWILDTHRPLSALEIIATSVGWVVSLEDFDPAVDRRPAALAVFPREEDAREFVAKVKRGVSPDDALRILREGH